MRRGVTSPRASPRSPSRTPSPSASLPRRPAKASLERNFFPEPRTESAPLEGAGALLRVGLDAVSGGDSDLARGTYRRGSSTHRRKVRAWQMLCVLAPALDRLRRVSSAGRSGGCWKNRTFSSRSPRTPVSSRSSDSAQSSCPPRSRTSRTSRTESGGDDRLAGSIETALKKAAPAAVATHNLPGVRYYAEVFFTLAARSYPCVVTDVAIPALRSPDVKPLQAASRILIGAGRFVRDKKIEPTSRACNGLTSGDQDRCSKPGPNPVRGCTDRRDAENVELARETLAAIAPCGSRRTTTRCGSSRNSRRTRCSTRLASTRSKRAAAPEGRPGKTPRWTLDSRQILSVSISVSVASALGLDRCCSRPTRRWSKFASRAGPCSTPRSRAPRRTYSPGRSTARRDRTIRGSRARLRRRVLPSTNFCEFRREGFGRARAAEDAWLGATPCGRGATSTSHGAVRVPVEGADGGRVTGAVALDDDGRSGKRVLIALTAPRSLPSRRMKRLPVRTPGNERVIAAEEGGGRARGYSRADGDSMGSMGTRRRGRLRG